MILWTKQDHEVTAASISDFLGGVDLDEAYRGLFAGAFSNWSDTGGTPLAALTVEHADATTVAGLGEVGCKLGYIACAEWRDAVCIRKAEPTVECATAPDPSSHSKRPMSLLRIPEVTFTTSPATAECVLNDRCAYLLRPRFIPSSSNHFPRDRWV